MASSSSCSSAAPFRSLPPTQADQATAIVFERFRSEGVGTVLLAGVGAGPLELAQNTGYTDFDFATAIEPGIIERQDIDPNVP